MLLIIKYGVDDFCSDWWIVLLEGNGIVAEKLDSTDLVNFKELLMANSIQVDALAQLLIEKGIITTDEFFDKLN